MTETPEQRIMRKAGTQAWIGVDLDGTLAHYDKWDDLGGVGEPIPLMIDRVKGWLSQNVQVKIVTARVSLPEQAAEQRQRVQEWCLLHLGQMLEVVCSKDLWMIELWDDRAVQVERNTGRAIGRE